MVHRDRSFKAESRSNWCTGCLRTPDYRWQGQMKISENPCFMYGQNFKNFPQNVRIGAGMRRKNQNLFGLPIWPPKKPNLFGLANQASKNAEFVWIGPEITIFARLSVSTQTNYVIIHSPSIPSALVPAAPDFPQPFFCAATIGVIGLCEYPVCQTINK